MKLKELSIRIKPSKEVKAITQIEGAKKGANPGRNGVASVL